MVLNPKIPLAQINAVPMMEGMTSRVNHAFSASGFLGAVNPWGDAQAEACIAPLSLNTSAATAARRPYDLLTRRGEMV
jgi:hypothetical protein